MLAPITVGDLQEWGRLFTRVEVWEPLVREICRRHSLGTPREIRAGYPGSHAVFVVGDAVVVKIAAPFWREDFAREQELYRLLEDRDELLAPRLLASGIIEAGQPWPYFLMVRRPGARIADVWPEVPPRDRHRIAEHLGRMTRVLHDFPVDQLPWPDATSAAWREFVERQLAGCVVHHGEKESLPEHLLEQLPDYLASIGPLCPADFRPRLLNCDITEDHVLLSRVGGRWEITGWIDFGDARVGDPEYEWVAVGLGALASEVDVIRRFLTAYGWEWWGEAFNRRMLAWSLLHLFSDMRPFLERLGGADRVRDLEELRRWLWHV
jgi:hygromycin-B 7''-O-kinase